MSPPLTSVWRELGLLSPMHSKALKISESFWIWFFLSYEIKLKPLDLCLGDAFHCDFTCLPWTKVIVYIIERRYWKACELVDKSMLTIISISMYLRKHSTKLVRITNSPLSRMMCLIVKSKWCLHLLHQKLKKPPYEATAAVVTCRSPTPDKANHYSSMAGEDAHEPLTLTDC